MMVIHVLQAKSTFFLSLGMNEREQLLLLKVSTTYSFSTALLLLWPFFCDTRLEQM